MNEKDKPWNWFLLSDKKAFVEFVELHLVPYLKEEEQERVSYYIELLVEICHDYVDEIEQIKITELRKKLRREDDDNY